MTDSQLGGSPEDMDRAADHAAGDTPARGGHAGPRAPDIRRRIVDLHRRHLSGVEPAADGVYQLADRRGRQGPAGGRHIRPAAPGVRCRVVAFDHGRVERTQRGAAPTNEQHLAPGHAGCQHGAGRRHVGSLGPVIAGGFINLQGRRCRAVDVAGNPPSAHVDLVAQHGAGTCHPGRRHVGPTAPGVRARVVLVYPAEAGTPGSRSPANHVAFVVDHASRHAQPGRRHVSPGAP